MNNDFDKTFKDLVGAYYGDIYTKKKKRKQYPPNIVTYAKVFDNGDILIQKEKDHSFDEYVVMQSSSDDENAFEEYVVQSSLPDTNNYEEYVARSEQPDSQITDLYAVSASVGETEVQPAEEYKIDLIGSSDNNDSPAPKNYPASTTHVQYEEKKPDPPPGNNNEVPVPSKEMSKTSGGDKDFEEDFQAIISGKKVF